MSILPILLIPLMATLLGTPLLPATLAEGAAPSYSRDVAPIIQRRCQECHRPGEAAPMALLDYAGVRAHAKTIRRVVERREMPPWHADPTYGEWRNDRRLSDEELKTLLSWVDAGAPEGDPTDLPPPIPFIEGWRIGKPDVVFQLPREFTVKASGEVPYQYFTVPTDFKEDHWIQAAEARPGNRAVVHHIIVFVQEPEKRGLDSKNLWSTHLCGTAPGEEADAFPPGTAKLVKAGSKLIFQMHYTPSGKEEKDRSQVGLIFAREPVRQRIQIQGAMNQRFILPPGANNHQVTSAYRFKQDSVILALMPHMHLRGKDFRYELLYPDGRRDTILNVPRYDFSWQHSYVPKAPIRVPEGTRLECTAHFDNSTGNPANPDPTREVRWGDQTWEEMMIGFVTFTQEHENLLAPAAAAPAESTRAF